MSYFRLISLLENTAEKLIADPRPDFEHLWKKLTLSQKLITSFLSDLNALNKDGQHYFLDLEHELFDILDLTRFDQIVKQLYPEYVTAYLLGHKFEEFPIKVRLFSNWIEKLKPIDRILRKNYLEVSKLTSLDKIYKSLEKVKKNKLSNKVSKVILVSKKWDKLKKELNLNTIIDNSFIKEYIDAFGGLVGANVEYIKKDNLFSFDITKYRLGLKDLFIIVQDKDEFSETEIDEICTGITNDPSTGVVTLFFVTKLFDNLEYLKEKDYVNIIVIQEQEVKDIVTSKKPYNAFSTMLSKKLPVQLLSPYETSGPAKRTFYGRKNIITKIIFSEKNYIILGPSKSGKTSIITKIIEQLNKSKQVPIKLPIQLLHDKFEDILEIMYLETCKKLNFELNTNIPVQKKQMTEFLKDTSENENVRIIFIIDDVASLLEFDKLHNYEIGYYFKTLSDDSLCRFVIAGFRELYHATKKENSAFRNFGEEIRLGSLDRSPAKDLITLPMKKIGVKYHSNSIVDTILEQTNCHPQLIQYFCASLIEKLDNHDNAASRRTITKKDYDSVFVERYEKHIEDMYLSSHNYNEIQQNIIKWVAKNSNLALDLNDFSIIKGINVSKSEVVDSLDLLILGNILKHKGDGKYSLCLNPMYNIITRQSGFECKTSTAQVDSRFDTIFISYSKSDLNLKQRIVESMSVLEIGSNIRIVEDTMIHGGADWDKEIQIMIKKAKIIIMLVSQNYFNTEYIKEKEFSYIETNDKALIIPVLLSDCLWDITWIKDINIRPSKGLKTFINMTDKEFKEEISKIIREIYKYINVAKTIK